MNEVFKQIIGGIVRNALTSIFTLLVAKGWLSSSDVPTGITLTMIAGGIAGVACTIIWSVWRKLAERYKLNVALVLPVGTTNQDLNDAVAAAPVSAVVQNQVAPALQAATDNARNK